MEQQLKDHECELEEAKTTVEVVVKNVDAVRTSGTIYDPFFDRLTHCTANGNSDFERISINKGNLKELADAAVIGQAKADVEKAEKAQKKAEAELKSHGDFVNAELKRADKIAEGARKEVKKKVEEAIQRAERSNLSKIGELETDIKGLEHENDLMLDQRRLVEQESDLTIAALNKQISLLNSKIEILETRFSNSCRYYKKYHMPHKHK